MSNIRTPLIPAAGAYYKNCFYKSEISYLHNMIMYKNY